MYKIWKDLEHPYYSKHLEYPRAGGSRPGAAHVEEVHVAGGGADGQEGPAAGESRASIDRREPSAATSVFTSKRC